MIPTELLVRITPGGPSAFGSGVLISRCHVLTCAHVLDSEYGKGPFIGREMGWPFTNNDGPEHNRVLRETHATRKYGVLTYDGTYRRARLARIHENHDLVLLELLAPLPHDIQPLPFQTDHSATKDMPIIGIGFQQTGEERWTLVRTALELGAPDNGAHQAISTVLQGQVYEGMSGGAAVAERGGRLTLIGLMAQGGTRSAVSTCIRAQVLAPFVKEALGASAPEAQARQRPGLVPQFPAAPHDRDLDGPLSWIRLTSPPPAEGKRNDGTVRFIAARPLTFADIDSITGYRPPGRAGGERSRFFAPMTHPQALEVCKRFTEKLKETISIPDADARKAFRPTGAAGPAHGDGKAAGLMELSLPPEWPRSQRAERTAPCFPGRGIPEWNADLGEARLAVPANDAEGWEMQVLGRETTGAARHKALLRPMLSIPVWAGGA